jgi:hypothetical protein
MGVREDEDDETSAHDKQAGHAAATKLLSSIESGELTIFDRRETAALQRMARLWLGFESVGIAMNMVKNVLIAIGVLAGAYIALKEWLHGVAK